MNKDDIAMRWVPDLFDERIPMAIELIGIALVLPFADNSGSLINNNGLTGFITLDDSIVLPSIALGVEPPPPRRLG